MEYASTEFSAILKASPDPSTIVFTASAVSLADSKAFLVGSLSKPASAILVDHSDTSVLPISSQAVIREYASSHVSVTGSAVALGQERVVKTSEGNSIAARASSDVNISSWLFSPEERPGCVQ